MNVHTDLFLDPEDTITVAEHNSADYVRIKIGAAGHAVYVTVDSLPQRIAELQAVELALRNLVDDLIADDRAEGSEPQAAPEPLAPDWETVIAADLTKGRRIQLGGYEQPGEWRTIVDLGDHNYLPGVIWLQLDDGQLVTLNDRDAVRALVVEAVEPQAEPVAEPAEVA